MVCACICVLHLGSGNETTLLTGSLLKTRGGETLVTVEKKSCQLLAQYLADQVANVVVKWHYEGIHLCCSSFGYSSRRLIFLQYIVNYMYTVECESLVDFSTKLMLHASG